MFCGYLTAGRGVVLCELWLLRSRNSDIPTQSFFPILWWRHDESFVPARLLLSLHVVASKVERKWKGKFILFPSPLSFFRFFFFLLRVYILLAPLIQICATCLSTLSLWKPLVWVQAPWPAVWLGRADCLDSSRSLMFLPCHTLHIHSLRSLEYYSKNPKALVYPWV